jgi:proline iminopeptidase
LNNQHKQQEVTMTISGIPKFLLVFLALLSTALLFPSCGGNQKSKSTPEILTTGEARLAVPGGNIWYKITGTPNGTPVVLLHGGPGFSSFYLKPFEDLGNDRQVVRYDQLGGGKSDKITDTTMFTIEHFVRELDSLRSHLGVAKWHVFGHSWGTILAIEYYRAHPDRVVSLTFGSACFDIPAYERRAKELLATLSKTSQLAVKKTEASGKYNDPGYQKAVDEFYALYLFRHPIKEDLDSTFGTANEGIYVYMQGPSEFTITGTLKKYDATPSLPQIKVPTLFTVGEFDEVGPAIVRGFADKTPHARFVQFAGSAHITSWDARDENVKVVREFLRVADSLAVEAKR